MVDEPENVPINTKIPNLFSLRFGFIASTIRLLYIIYVRLELDSDTDMDMKGT